MSNDKAEFRKMRRLVGVDEAKNVIDNQKISDALIANGIMRLADKNELLVLHDGSDIRKKYSKELESIGKVRDLDGHIINGYHSFNSVAVDLHGKLVTPIATGIGVLKALFPNFRKYQDQKTSKTNSQSTTPTCVLSSSNPAA